jgi:biopolymer transport protein TolQ
MTPDFSVLHLIGDASTVVQLVMLLLLLVSVASWALIFAKRKELKVARRMTDRFEQRFWSGIDIASLYKDLAVDGGGRGGIENIFLAGYREFASLRRQLKNQPLALLEGSQRAMRVAQSREIDRLDQRLPLLATVGSTSPYVGLFGTVWGIMNSFRSLGNVQQATLALVAPGISEALIATAMGLFAAIPAVIAYNRYATELDRLSLRYELFIEEFVNLLRREAHKPEARAQDGAVSQKQA